MPGNACIVGRVLGITMAKVVLYGPQIGALGLYTCLSPAMRGFRKVNGA